MNRDQNRAVRSSRQAFTLVEVLVSLAIFALAAVVLATAYVNVLDGYRSQEQSRRASQGMQLARIVVLTQPDRQILEAGGALNLPDHDRLVWAAEVKPTTIADLFAVVLDARVTGGQGWHRQERIMLYRPAWSETHQRDQLRENSRDRLARQRSA